MILFVEVVLNVFIVVCFHCLTKPVTAAVIVILDVYKSTSQRPIPRYSNKTGGGVVKSDCLNG